MDKTSGRDFRSFRSDHICLVMERWQEVVAPSKQMSTVEQVQIGQCQEGILPDRLLNLKDTDDS